MFDSVFKHVGGSGAAGGPDGQSGVSVLARADDLRRRLTRVLIVVAIAFAIAMSYAGQLFIFLKQPLVAAIPNAASDLHFTGPMEVFLCYLKAAFAAAAVVVAPYVLWEIWRFIGPLLDRGMRRSVPLLFAASVVLFYSGALFCQLVIMPVTLKFLVGMGEGVATAMITFDEYFGLVSFMLVGFGVAFELPLVLIVLERLGVLRRELITKNRGVILVLILIVAAILTPTPDPFSQLSLAVPMYLMVEIAVLCMRRPAAAGQAVVATGTSKEVSRP